MSTKDFIGYMLIMILLIMVCGGLFSLLWNVTMPYIFGLPSIGMGRGIAFYVLIRLLISGISFQLYKGE
ncbi:hypothetical protein [Bacillus andreraoultii]|uniref:hypothetical protein n=1 Tax=Bacillus andreraoultii TaxID=1499685 RepID=UPI00053A91EE|nr:hypothetical protein [Bacillus andreraoultii]